MDKFKTFIQDAKVDGLQYSSMHYTWMNQCPENLIMQKLDRVLVNEKWSLMRSGVLTSHCRKLDFCLLVEPFSHGG